MQALVRTPDQHELAGTRGPRLKPSQHSDLPVAGLQESATSPSREMKGKNLNEIKLLVKQFNNEQQHNKCIQVAALAFFL